MPLSAIHFSSRARSPALCHRSSGSLARHVATTRSIAGGVSGCSAETGAGAADMIAALTLAWLVPSNAFLPVSISYSTAPNAKMSVRASASRPSSCSGAMYWHVPRTVPGAVKLGGDVVSLRLARTRDQRNAGHSPARSPAALPPVPRPRRQFASA